MSKRSRLNKHIERQSQKNLILSLLGLAAVVFLFVKFGIPFIADLGFLSSKIASKSSGPSSKTNDSFLTSPTLDNMQDATNSAQIKLTGFSTTGKVIAIYLNGSLSKKLSIKDDGAFESTLSLSEGENIIKAQAIDGNRESDFSGSITILYKNTPPSLSVDVSDGSTVKNSPLNVTGKTDLDVKVTVNDFWAIVDSSGNYSYNLSLKNGDNQIKVVATDKAGNKAEKSIKINYSP